MKKLNDYSGEFRPDLRLGDFSPDTLVELLALYGKLYMALDGFWYLAIKERVSNEEALACDIRVWERASRYEMTNITKRLNIQGNDVIALMKGFQVSPWFWNLRHKVEIENRNNAILTITHCPTLDALENEGEGREREICQLVEPRIWNGSASAINPDMEVKCLKSPPRKNRDEICCQWEFKLEGE